MKILEIPEPLAFKKSHAVDAKKMQAEPLHGVEQDMEVCVKVESVSSFESRTLRGPEVSPRSLSELVC